MNMISHCNSNFSDFNKKSVEQIDISLLVLPGFQMEEYSLFASVIDFVNIEQKEKRIVLTPISENGGIVEGSCDTSLNTKSVKESDILSSYTFVFSCPRRRFSDRVSMMWFLSKRMRSQNVIGAVGGGVFALAETGLLKGRKVPVHWRQKEIFSELYPDVTISDEMFEEDGCVWTSSGRTAALDIAIHFVSEVFGHRLAVETAKEFNHSRLSTGAITQSSVLLKVPGTGSRIVNEAINLFRNHLEDLISMDEISTIVKVSRRQLERQFSRHCGTTPQTFYRNLRLARARELIHLTDYSISEVAFACGFSGTSGLAHAYRSRYGLTPSIERNRSVLASHHLAG